MVDRLGQPWKGLSAKEERFLGKATEGKVQVIGDDAKIDLKEVRFKAPSFVETPAGWIPLPRKPGIQSVRASTLMSERMWIEMTRNGEAYEDVEPSLVFLRDGDQLKKQRPGGSQRPRPPARPR
ncbi:MAG: hypothetical protein EOP83_18310 [Verrucomicrobiaceae bacterium]|nr:MAG: hypothetical protein EOP83_18310 [Verrucomicrobiaceae bacterium]